MKDDERLMPRDTDIERLVLGYVMVRGILEFDLSPDDFYAPAHKRIAKTILVLVERGKSPDMMSVISELRASKQEGDAVDVAYITSMTDNAPRFKDALSEQYVEILRQKAALRSLIKSTADAMTRAYDDAESFSEISKDLLASLDDAQTAIEPKAGPMPMDAAVMEAYNEIEAISEAQKKGILHGVRLGFTELDKLISTGLKNDDFMVIGGRPTHGKTSFLLGVLQSMASQGKKIMFFSIEMSRLRIIMKLFALVAEVPLSAISAGFVGREDWPKLQKAASTMTAWKVWIDDATGTQVADIRSRLRRLREPVDVIMIDYIQLLQVPKHLERASGNDKVAYISTHLKFLNKAMKIPIVACSQLSRATEKRRGAKPQLSDLRESGQIEQDCDIALLIYRPEVVNPTDENSGIGEIILAKQRNGPSGEFKLAWIGQYAKFDNMWEGETEEKEQWYDK